VLRNHTIGVLQLGQKSVVWIVSNRIHKRSRDDPETKQGLKPVRENSTKTENRKNLINDVLKGMERLLRNL